MLLIRSGKIHAKNLTFALPENMYFYYDMDTYAEDRLRFTDKSQTLELNIHVIQYKPDYSIDNLINHETFVATSSLFNVNRGGLEGKGIFYRNRVWNYECYEEQLDIGEGYIASIRLTCDVNPNTRERIRTVLMMNPIKNFFKNIQKNYQLISI